MAIVNAAICYYIFRYGRNNLYAFDWHALEVSIQQESITKFLAMRIMHSFILH
jgi:hypothetical protein